LEPWNILEPWEGFFSLGFGFTLRCEIFALGIQFATDLTLDLKITQTLWDWLMTYCPDLL